MAKRKTIYRKIPRGWNTKLHVVAANDKVAVGFLLSGGEVGDGPKGHELLERLGHTKGPVALFMDRAYERDETRALAISLGYNSVVPPKKNRKHLWEYDKELYKKRNKVEQFFRRYKRFRRICTRYDKLDIMFLTFLHLRLSLMR
jgi:transposase